MSIVAVIVDPENCAMMACDGVASHPEDGCIVGYASKITLMPELDAAMGVTGIYGLAQIMQWFMPLHVSNFDDLVDALPELMEQSCEQLGHMSGTECGKCCCVVVGWSDARQKYEGWRIANYDKGVRMGGADSTVSMLEAFTTSQLTDNKMWSSTGPDSVILRKFGVIDGPDESTDVDVLRRMICAGRADSGRKTDQYDHFNAGGFIQLASVQRGYVQSAINHRWPEDVIGEPIDPTRGKPMPDDLMAHYDAQA